jgi:hypothetical protein
MSKKLSSNASSTPIVNSVDQPPIIEMRDAVNGVCMNLFSSLENAQLASKISEKLILKACREGGGLVEDKYFRFVEGYEWKTENKHLSFDEPPQKKRLPKKTEKKMTPPKHNLAIAAQFGGPKPPYTFDVSRLLPIKSQFRATLRPPKVVELLDKGTNEVIVCFRGITNAHQALGINRGFATMACHSYGTASQFDFKDYVLRYAADQDAPLVAYEYGCHEDDRKKVNETHQERMARWARIMQEERRGASASAQALSPSKKKRKAPAPPPVRPTPPPAPSFRGRGTIGDSIVVADITVPSGITNETDTSMMCIMCQETKAEIVLEPCHHCVLCARCADTACKTFCPSCRTKIIGRIQPTTIRIVRPQIYSAYSFM